MSCRDSLVVLIVEDERALADLYTEWLDESFSVRTTYSGDDAISLLDDEIDVVLLDRRIPGQSGDKVLEEIQRRDLSCRVAMVTAVEPDFDIIEMGFDEYLIKPVTKSDLYDTVIRLNRRNSYTRDIQKLASLASKKSVLETKKSQKELANSDEYEKLEDEFMKTRERADAALESLDHTDYKVLFRDLGLDPASAEVDDS